MNRRQRVFVYSKCDRCGKATTGKSNGTDLYALPHEWDIRIADAGAFCNPCIAKYSEANWLEWILKNRP